MIDRPAWVLLGMDWQTYKNLPLEDKRKLLQQLGHKFVKPDLEKIERATPPGGYMVQAWKDSFKFPPL